MKYTFLLKFFSKNLDQIISVFTKLDQMLDAYIAREEAKAAELDRMLEEIQKTQIGPRQGTGQGSERQSQHPEKHSGLTTKYLP